MVRLLAVQADQVLGQVLYRGKGEISPASVVHIGLGWLLGILGVMSGGIGMSLAKDAMTREIAHDPVSAVIRMAVLGISIWDEVRRR